MKSLSLFLILFIIKSSISKIEVENYSVNLFIDKLKKEGTFEIIKSIKEECGQDIAILSCEEINENHCGNCRKVVIFYMPDFPPHGPIIHPSDKPQHGLSKDLKDDLYNILKKKFPQTIANSKYDKIIYKAEKSNII